MKRLEEMHLRWPQFATVLAVVVAFVCGLGIWQVSRTGDIAQMDALRVESLSRLLREENALQWQALSGHVSTSDVRKKITTLRDERRQLKSELVTIENKNSEVCELHKLYTQAVDNELTSIENGRPPSNGSQSLAQTLFLETSKALTTLRERALEESKLATRSSNIQTTVYALIGVLFIGLLDSFIRQSSRRQQLRLKQKQQYEDIISQTDDLILVVDDDGVINYATPSAQTRLNLTVGKSQLSDIQLQTDECTEQEAFTALPDEPAIESGVSDESILGLDQQVVKLKSLDGAVTGDYILSINDLRENASVNGIVVTAHDVTEQRQLEANLCDLAMRDALTHLPNRRAFSLELDSVLTKEGAAITLILLDLDNFKQINDVRGHRVGDLILKALAERLSLAMRHSASIFRLGGDEFAILLPHKNSSLARATAERVLELTSQPLSIDGQYLSVNGSIGVASSEDLSEAEQPAEQIMIAVDLALTESKHRGKGTISLYAPAMMAATLRKSRLADDLKTAIANNSLEVYFQPLVNVAHTATVNTKEIVGMEALARWPHPIEGMVPPNEFIEIAEENSLIADLGEWMIDAVLAYQTTSHSQLDGHSVPISINVSPLQLRDGEFVDRLCKKTEDAGIERTLLKIEITESCVIDVSANEAINKLRNAGFKVAMDDFGTAYSTLSQIEMVNVDEIKIDMMFTRGVDTDPRKRAVIAGVVTLAQQLGVSLIAEGVETLQQEITLRGLGISLMQGYRFARPCPANDLPAKLTLTLNDGSNVHPLII